MKRLSAFAAGLLLIGLAAFPLTQTASGQAVDGWITLVDGTKMGDWDHVGEANWRMEDGALVADKRPARDGSLVSKNSYKDFQIKAEFWASDDANSGIFIRCRSEKIGAKTCYEVNIFDTRKDPSYGTGAIVNFAEVNPMPKAGGKWNTVEITAKGRQIVVVFNGQKTVDFRNGLFDRRTDHAAVRRRRHQVPQGADQAAVAGSKTPVRPRRGRTVLLHTTALHILDLYAEEPPKVASRSIGHALTAAMR